MSANGSPFGSPGQHAAFVRQRSPGDAGWWWLAVASAAVVALVGIAAPRLALRAALVLALAVAAVAVLQAIVRFCQRVPAAATSDFARPEAPPPPEIPPHIRALQPIGEGDRALTVEAHRAIATIATERLWARHRLNLHNPQHHAHIHRLVSPTLWRAFTPPSYAVTDPVLHRQLPELIDELEQL